MSTTTTTAGTSTTAALPADFDERAATMLAALLRPGDVQPRVYAVIQCLTSALLEATARVSALEKTRDGK
jgi:hypothetical protein